MVHLDSNQEHHPHLTVPLAVASLVVSVVASLVVSAVASLVVSVVEGLLHLMALPMVEEVEDSLEDVHRLVMVPPARVVSEAADHPHLMVRPMLEEVEEGSLVVDHLPPMERQAQVVATMDSQEADHLLHMGRQAQVVATMGSQEADHLPHMELPVLDSVAATVADALLNLMVLPAQEDLEGMEEVSLVEDLLLVMVLQVLDSVVAVVVVALRLLMVLLALVVSVAADPQTVEVLEAHLGHLPLMVRLTLVPLANLLPLTELQASVVLQEGLADPVNLLQAMVLPALDRQVLVAKVEVLEASLVLHPAMELQV